MADLATNLEQIDSGQASNVVTANNLIDAASPAIYGGRHAEACTGRTWAYYGGRWGGTLVANGTLTLPANEAAVYIVVHRGTGVLSAATTTTNWLDTGTYARTYKATTGTAVVTGYEDHRTGPYGVFSGGSGGGTLADGDMGDVVVSGSGTVLSIDSSVLTTFGRTVTGAASASAGRTALGLAIGSDVQAFDSDLSTFAGLTATTDSFLQAKSSAWAARTVAQVLVDLQGDGLTVGAAGFRGIPLNSQSTAYTLVAADAGKMIYHPAADTTARTWTIPANGSVAFPVGTAITFDNDFGAGALTIAITTDTLVLVGTAGTTGSRTIAAGGQATAVKVTSTRWRISGTGLS